jgi:hypothetical protein
MIKKCTWERLAMERRSEICRLKLELKEAKRMPIKSIVMQEVGFFICSFAGAVIAILFYHFATKFF